MRKVAWVFVLAVFGPSVLLAWLAVRSVRDQQFVVERQQTLLFQQAADALARAVQNHFHGLQQAFRQEVDNLIAEQSPFALAGDFDAQLRRAWPLAEVGFTVLLEGRTNAVLAPSPLAGGPARQFRLENDRFLCSRETVEVYWNSPKGPVNLAKFDALKESRKSGRTEGGAESGVVEPAGLSPEKTDAELLEKAVFATKAGKLPKSAAVSPEPREDSASTASAGEEAEFRSLIGDSTEGTLARFLQDRLNILLWYRPPREPRFVFGAQLQLDRLVAGMRDLVRVDPSLHDEICVALLNDAGRPVVVSHSGFRAEWKHPFVATDIGEILPHWQVGAYLLNPGRFGQTARTLTVTLGLLIAVLLLAIAVGGWLLVADVRRQHALSRQKTDFVSNVSHELKTPLTSIRMFSELLAEGRVPDDTRRQQFLNIITAETARLTRLINNVLDFARLERGEKKYRFAPCDLGALAHETFELYRPHLEAAGFKLAFHPPSEKLPPVLGDSDALAQVLVNLISNAEKYSGDRKEIEVDCGGGANGGVAVRVLDRGLGVPPGFEEKIFEQFFRAHDSLSSGIQGSGLGLTLARQIARAHGGEVSYAPREGGGSCFALWLPFSKSAP